MAEQRQKSKTICYRERLILWKQGGHVNFVIEFTFV